MKCSYCGEELEENGIRVLVYGVGESPSPAYHKSCYDKSIRDKLTSYVDTHGINIGAVLFLLKNRSKELGKNLSYYNKEGQVDNFTECVYRQDEIDSMIRQIENNRKLEYIVGEKTSMWNDYIEPQEAQPTPEKPEEKKCDKCGKVIESILRGAFCKSGLGYEFCSSECMVSFAEPEKPEEYETVKCVMTNTSGETKEFEVEVPKGIHIYNTEPPAESTEIEELKDDIIKKIIAEGMTTGPVYAVDKRFSPIIVKINELVRLCNRLAKERK